ncbi:MAG TPA: hypothetical protein VNG69_11000 [Casimicrobiaceae bacterium]|nr:hypothetical protein [Casimicrobiaceae bacterium]
MNASKEIQPPACAMIACNAEQTRLLCSRAAGSGAGNDDESEDWPVGTVSVNVC